MTLQLGFGIDWEVQAGPGGPKYVQVSRGPVVLHLTEHYGDCSPWAKVFNQPLGASRS